MEVIPRDVDIGLPYEYVQILQNSGKFPDLAALVRTTTHGTHEPIHNVPARVQQKDCEIRTDSSGLPHFIVTNGSSHPIVQNLKYLEVWAQTLQPRTTQLSHYVSLSEPGCLHSVSK